MRPVFLLFLLFCILIGTVPARAGIPDGYAPAGPGATYLALGDSLVTGSNSQGTPTLSYAERMHQRLALTFPELGFNADLARDSETSATILNDGQLAAAEAFIAAERAAGRDVGLVTLSIGGNDLANVLINGADPQMTLTNFRTNYAQILDRLLAALTVEDARRGDLLLLNYYNPYPGFSITEPPFNLADIYVPQLNAIIAEEAASRGLPVADAATAFAGREAELIFVNREACENLVNPFINCDYHPTEGGQQAMADSLLDVTGYEIPERMYLPTLQR